MLFHMRMHNNEIVCFLHERKVTVDVGTNNM